MKEKPVRSETPTDELGRIAADMLAAMPGENPPRAVIFLDDGKRALTALSGYDSDLDAMVEVLMHLKAVFAANGKTLMFAPIKRG